MQFYLTAAIIKIFHTGISFLSLKIVTATVGVITLFFIFLLAKQLESGWVAQLAMFLTGIAYWPNVLSRVALRFAFYPLFAASCLYFLIKGLSEKSRNSLILCGIFLGLGLHGYSPARILPFLVVAGFIIFWLSRKPEDRKSDLLWSFCLLALAAFLVFLPLFRYFLENPQSFAFRTLSRLTPMERTLEGSALVIFLNNFWKSCVMFFYNNGNIWVHSIPGRPALDWVSAAFYFVGLVVTIKKYFRYRHWQDLLLLISVPILMLPSILSIAFPQENPSLNRSGAAIVPVAIIAAKGLVYCFKGILDRKTKIELRIVLASSLLSLLTLSGVSNYDLVFRQYARQFTTNAWNSSEMGEEITKFVQQGNSYENAFVVPYAHWVDTRLVGINAGLPGKDFALWPKDFKLAELTPGNKLFILKPEDQNNLRELKNIFPQGIEEVFYSRTAGKNFIMYTVNAE